MSNPLDLHDQTRRHFLGGCGLGLGGIALQQMLAGDASAKYQPKIDPAQPMSPRKAPEPAKAKNVIFLHMAGAPSQLELFEHKPKLNELSGQKLPDSLLENMRFAFIQKETVLFNQDVTGFFEHWHIIRQDRLP